MTKYIEHEALRDALYDADAITFKGLAILNNFPAADVAPVRHGRWISIGHKASRICSICHADEPYKNADREADVYNFCPFCGAKMDNKEGE